MKNKLILIALLFFTFYGTAQTADDLFNPTQHNINWLGVDFYNVKLIGRFSNFEDAGNKGVSDIKEIYFPSWNNLILNEPNKYDIAGMLKKEVVRNEPEMLTTRNSNTIVDSLLAYNSRIYTKENIQEFVNEYDTKGLTGIGIALVAEELNKSKQEAHFHFVAINLSNNQLLIHERIKGKPAGFGLRNYWAGSIYSVIKQIKGTYYKKWKKLNK